MNDKAFKIEGIDARLSSILHYIRTVMEFKRIKQLNFIF